MKNLLIVRHAKSSWDNPTQKDFDRPLNDRGHKDAPTMAKRMLQKKIPIDVFVSSNAERALTTCKYFAEAYEVKEKDILIYPELYHAPPHIFYQVIRQIKNKHSTAAIFSHNPGITSFVNELTATRVDNMPTCGVFAIKIHTDSWSAFEEAKKEFWFFDYPKLSS